MDLDDDLPRDPERDAAWDELGEESQASDEWERMDALTVAGWSGPCAAATVRDDGGHKRCRRSWCECACHVGQAAPLC